MRWAAVALAVALLLIGCTTNISQIKDKWGEPAKVEDRGETTAYYYYGKRRRGVVVVEFITNKDGKILTKRKYWEQPKPEDIK